MLTAGTAHAAPLDICNRSSLIADAAIGLQSGGGRAAQGWFRLLPGVCTNVLRDDLDADAHYLHIRPLPLYGDINLMGDGDVTLCVRDTNFLIAAAGGCERQGQRPAPFVKVNPVTQDGRLTASIDEPAGYDSEQAETAGMQRLLSLLGYETGAIDGKAGARTDAALEAFKQENGSTEGKPFDMLLEALSRRKSAAPPRLCNDTDQMLVAAIGIPSEAATVTRGWFPIEPGTCRTPLTQLLSPGPLYTFAEAVDADGASLGALDPTLQWGGDITLCTQNLEFALTAHEACETRGLTTTGFEIHAIEAGQHPIIRFAPR